MLSQLTKHKGDEKRFGRILLLVPLLHDACPLKLVERVFLQPALGDKTIHTVIMEIHKN
jgi:hypothetical protein